MLSHAAFRALRARLAARLAEEARVAEIRRRRILGRIKVRTLRPVR